MVEALDVAMSRPPSRARRGVAHLGGSPHVSLVAAERLTAQSPCPPHVPDCGLSRPPAKTSGEITHALGARLPARSEL
ncbi:MAG: hypothetical protein M0R74_12375 [Dehalococcoidia bacterium]|nr:hypothetical protein [Dehalococcoidia bacterium]